VARAWVQDYNEVRPHSSIGRMPPGASRAFVVDQPPTRIHRKPNPLHPSDYDAGSLRTTGVAEGCRSELDQRYRRRPGHDLIHLFKEDLLAGLLGQRVRAERDLVHAPHRLQPSCLAPVAVPRGFADLPQSSKTIRKITKKRPTRSTFTLLLFIGAKPPVLGCREANCFGTW
jgi:Integrase core domain